MTQPTFAFDVHQRVPFHGSDYVDRRDRPRLETQFDKIRKLMSDHQPRTLAEISAVTGFGEASISAQLRNLRKIGVTVEKQHIGGGLFKYFIP